MGSERLNEAHQVSDSGLAVIVWCILLKKELIEPCFFENKNVTEVTDKSLRQYYVFPKILNYPEDIIFQQNGAPPHFFVLLHQYLDLNY